MLTIPYQKMNEGSEQIPTFFIDYISDYPKLQPFLHQDYRSIKNIQSVLDARRAIPLDRETLCDVLNRQNAKFESSPRTFQNIAHLRRQNTYAVVTGQQVGLFGGPLYTLYKAITTIELAVKLNEYYPDARFVPVFWLEGEDHDLEEVSSTHLLDKDNSLLHITYPVSTPLPEKNVAPVGTIQFGEEIGLVFEELKKQMSETEFSPQLFSLLQDIYRPGVSFLDAFARFMNSILPDSGLIFIDPGDRDLKELVRPIFEKELATSPRACELMIHRSAQLEELGYHTPIKPKPINLFLIHKAGRYLIEPGDPNYSLKGTRQHISRTEMDEILTNSIERFSPNVSLRPIIQDSLLPTVVYVGGPTEISYFSQIDPLYEFFNIPKPILFPRISLTILESRIKKFIEKNSLQVSDFFMSESQLELQFLDDQSSVRVEDLFRSVRRKIREGLTELQFGLQQIDPTLQGALETTTEKIEASLTVLREKSIVAQRKKNDVLVKQFQKTKYSILPDNYPQERYFSPLYFINKYGFEFVGWLRQTVHLFQFEHGVIDLDDYRTFRSINLPE